jgi:hypothetical protein
MFIVYGLRFVLCKGGGELMAPLLKNFKSTIKYITNKSHVFNPFLAPILCMEVYGKKSFKIIM